MSAVGTPTRRLEGRDKVVGATRYTADLDVAGLLHVQLVLSHLASARIRSIETSAARSVPGGVDVVVAGDESEPIERPRNVSAVASTKRGDASAAMAGSDVTVKATYSVAAVHHTAMEPHVSTVRPEPGGGMTVWSPTQGPFALRDELADKLDIPAHKIRVVPMPVGGGFGGKVSLLEGLLALLAIRANRPLRLVLTRRQVFAFAKGAPAARFEIEIGAKKDGTLTALRARFSYDNGASAGWHGGISSAFLAGTYRWPAVDITGFEVSTNKTPVDAYRAPGAPQTYFALESAMDELAQKLDIDPIELRLRNAVSEGDIDGQGAKWPRVAFIECLEEAKAHP